MKIDLDLFSPAVSVRPNTIQKRRKQPSACVSLSVSNYKDDDEPKFFALNCSVLARLPSADATRYARNLQVCTLNQKVVGGGTCLTFLASQGVPSLNSTHQEKEDLSGPQHQQGQSQGEWG
jgi:hypothetical protein